MSNKVVLFFPPYAGPPLGPPLSLLSLASPLIEEGFRVSIVDGSVEPEYKRIVAREIKDAACLGISLLTGQMIRSAAEVARLVRKLRPALPIIFGGWHPSLLPAQTLNEHFVDIVVRAQGERTIVEIARLLSEGKPLDSVRGISLKRADGAHHNPDRPIENVNDLPTPAFDLGNFD
ncbi:MAG TPA: cobalamin-dependent protein, partial [Terriglobia bacterium]|nr:cobalamin-dependent protein [Terriglobia bacterium]